MTFSMKQLPVSAVLVVLLPHSSLAQNPFHLQEATINDIHNAIKTGQMTCQAIVQAYLNRAKAYNGVCTELVTPDGATIPQAIGAVRAGAPVKFPMITVPASRVLPDLDKYKGLP